MRLGALLFPVFLCCLPLVHQKSFRASAAESAGFVSQTYIDTLLQSAYTTLNATEELSRAALKKENAIAYAKRTAERLKKLAETDKNKKYILWKVQELEGQIFLEENGLLQEKDQKRHMAINELVESFNAEIAKSRPDFSKLENIRVRMKDLDGAKERELRYSLNDRISAVSMAAVYAIEQNIKKGDFDSSRSDLAYCKSYQSYLTISLTQYSTLAAKVQSKVSVDNEKTFIAATLANAGNAFIHNDLGSARAFIKTIDVRLDAIKGVMYEREWDKLYFGNKKIAKELERKEDSLVAKNLTLLKTQGVGVATQFSDSVLKKWDVAPEKISKVNYAILEAAVAKQKNEGNGLSKEVAALVDNQQEQVSVMDDILAAAKTKAKAKEDSIRAQQQTMHLTHVERVRLNNMRLAEQGKENREQQRMNENREKAGQMLVEIYTLLDKGNRKNAENLVNDNREFFKEFLAEEAYKKLDSAIIQTEYPKK